MLKWILNNICGSGQYANIIDKENNNSIFNGIPLDCFYDIINFIDSSKDFFSVFQINKSIRRVVLKATSFYFMEHIRFVSIVYPNREIPYVTDVCLDWNNDKLGVKSLTRFPNLQNLCIKHSNVSYFGGNCFSSLKNLNMREINTINGNHFKYFGKIEHLNMRFCNQKDITPDCFQYLEKNLRILNIQNCDQIIDDHLKHLKWVTTLVMTGVKNVTDKGISYLENIESLYIGRCDRLTGKTFDRLKKLKELHMWSCNGFIYFNNLKDIVYLNAEGCFQIQDKDLSQLKNIEKIFIGGVGMKITNKGLSYLKNIKFLGIGGNKNITHDGLNSLSNPEELIFNGCINVDKKKLRYNPPNYVWINDFRLIKKNFEKEWKLIWGYKIKGCNKKDFSLFG